MQSCLVLLKLGKDKPRKPKTWHSEIAMQRITFKCMIPTTQQNEAYLILAVSKDLEILETQTIKDTKCLKHKPEASQNPT